MGGFYAFLGFGIDDTDGYRVEMSSHTVHTKPDESNLLATPVEGGIRGALFLTAAVHSARHVVA